MGMIQQGFNQALTGATFLLQQTPQWKAGAEGQQAVREFNTRVKSSLNMIASLPKEYTNETRGFAYRRMNQIEAETNNLDSLLLHTPQLYNKWLGPWNDTYQKIMKEIQLHKKVLTSDPWAELLAQKAAEQAMSNRAMANQAVSQDRYTMQNQSLDQYKEWLKSQPKTAAKEEMNPNNASLRSGMAPRMD